MAPDIRDSRGDTAYHWAWSQQNYALCMALLDTGLHVDVADSKGRTPLLLACARRFDEAEAVGEVDAGSSGALKVGFHTFFFISVSS
mgnify:CR=1 FL=1